MSTTVDERSGRPDETTIERGNPLDSEIPEWLQEFSEKLVDDEIPAHGDSHASSSHEASFFLGIIVRRHHTGRKQMGLLKEQCAE